MSKAQEISDLAAQAGELVDNLKSLKERAGHYADATAALAEARAGLSKLVDETTRLAVLTHQTLNKLDQLGVASILDNLAALGADQKQTADQALENNTVTQSRLTELKQSADQAQKNHLEAQSHLTRLEAAQNLNRNLTFALIGGIVLLLVLSTIAMVKAR